MSEHTEAIYQEIRSRILSQAILPGTRLIEQKLALELSTGRTAIRESLKRLYGEGLIERRERRGFITRSWSQRELSEIRELREILETAAIRLACQRSQKKDWRVLRNICRDFEGMVASGFYLGALEADLLFHRTLVSLSGNSRLIATYQVANIPLFHYRIRTSVRMNDYDLTASEHRAIVDALEQRNPDQAEQLIRQHIARGASSLSQ
jgi:DNA-binding GntR family transcriptional regulator